MTTSVDIQKAKEQLPELLALALAGNEVLITDGIKTLVKIVPVTASGEKRIAGLHRGAMIASDDFDEPLGE